MSHPHFGVIMKTFFSLVNFVVGILALLIGFGNFLFLAHNPASTIAGLVSMVVGAACLWLASESILGRQQAG